MNILEIVPYSLFPIRNAGQESIIQFSSYLNDYGNVFVASVEIHPDLIKDYKITTYFPVFPNKKKRYLPLYNFFKLNKIIQENNINVLIVDHPYMALTTHFLAVKNKIPWFLRSHNIESDRFKSLHKWWFKLLLKYEKWTFNKATGIISVTEDDLIRAQKLYQISLNKCLVAPFGTTLIDKPQKSIHRKAHFCEQYKLIFNKPILYFIGSNDYLPNANAVHGIVSYLVPYLLKENLSYQILIIGKGLPKQIKENLMLSNYSIYYLDYLENLDDLWHAADVMINPITEGGGIKTKLVQALAHNITAVSFEFAAAGVSTNCCNHKLILATDNDWVDFTTKIQQSLLLKNDIDEDFYQIFSWQKIAQNVYEFIKNNSSNKIL